MVVSHIDFEITGQLFEVMLPNFFHEGPGMVRVQIVDRSLMPFSLQAT